MKPHLTRYWNLLLLTAAATVLSACGGTPTGPTYTTLFDAGSSGTRLSFYKVVPGNGGYPQISKIFEKEFNDNGINDFLNGTGTIELIDKNGANVLPGGARPTHCTGGSLDSTTNAPQVFIKNLGQQDVSPCVLEPMLAAQDAALAENGVIRQNVKVELFATAGMRTEESSNGGSWSDTDIRAYYQTMQTYVAGMGFATGLFKTTNGNSEEGLWTWVNLNDYYRNAFGGNTSVSQSVLSPVGDFEVGGSSMQIAFPTSADSSDSANIYKVAINGRTFNVYSKTLLGMGADDARKYVRAYQYSSQDGGLDCFATGATVSNTTEDSGVALYPSASLRPNLFPANLTTTTPWFTLTATALNLTGNPSFNPTTCGNKYDTVIGQVIALPRNKNNNDALASWQELKSKLTTSSQPFVGIDNFYWTASDLNLAVSTGFDKNTFATNLQTKCASTIAGSKLQQQAVCANGTFMNTLLFGTNGLFTNSSAEFSGVLSPRQNGSTVLTWTRGYLLLKYAN